MLGWLHVTPKDSDEPRIKTGNWSLPDCCEFEYIAEYFFELGCEYGIVEIDCLSRLTGLEFEHWEVDLLMKMTNIYSNSRIKYSSSDYDFNPPFFDKKTAAKTDGLTALKRALSRGKK